MMVKRYAAIVIISNSRQVEFEADDTHSPQRLKELALEIARREWGDGDSLEVDSLWPRFEILAPQPGEKD
jgi:hypothetical protein